MRICMIGCRWFLDDLSARTDLSFDEKMAICGKNTGNLFIGEAVRMHLQRHFGNKIELIEHYSFPMIRETNGHEIRDRFDYIVMAASNMINPQVDFGFVAKFVEESKLPIAIFGLGAQAENTDDRFSIVKGTKRLLDYAALNSPGIGVRGSYTAEVLSFNGINNVKIIGCPTAYINAGKNFEIRGPKSKEEIKRAALSYKRDRAKYQSDELLKEIQVSMMALAMDSGYDLIAQADYAETWMGYHREIDQKKLKNMSKYFRIDDARIPKLETYIVDHVFSFFTWHDWRAKLEGLDFAFGSRFHGNMMALNAGVPAVFIVHDTRTNELCETLNLPHISVNEINRKGGFDFSEIIGVANYDLFNTNFTKQCDNFDDFFTAHFV